MPYQVRKSSGGGYAIAKRLPGGRTRVVGHSASKSAAQASIRARNAAAHGARLSGGARRR